MITDKSEVKKIFGKFSFDRCWLVRLAKGTHQFSWNKALPFTNLALANWKAVEAEAKSVVSGTRQQEDLVILVALTIV